MSLEEGNLSLRERYGSHIVLAHEALRAIYSTPSIPPSQVPQVTCSRDNTLRYLSLGEEIHIETYSFSTPIGFFVCAQNANKNCSIGLRFLHEDAPRLLARDISFHSMSLGEESNLHYRLRSPMFCPLNYRGLCPQTNKIVASRKCFKSKGPRHVARLFSIVQTWFLYQQNRLQLFPMSLY